MKKLGVNIDHVATLRRVRGTHYPDPIMMALIAESAGADNITCHLREDRRHIQDRDLRILRETVKTPLNLEMAATQEMVRIALETKPDVVTLVPERREEITTEGGLDLSQNNESLSKTIGLLRESGCHVSLFVDPDPETIKLAHRLGAQSIEIHTGRFADAPRKIERDREWERIKESASFASKLRLGVHAGHGLHYQNVQSLLKIEAIESFQIGHSIVAQALFVGFEQAVRDMKALLVSNSLSK